MTNNENKFRRLCFLSKAYSLEQEDFLTQDKVCEDQFVKDFEEESEFSLRSSSKNVGDEKKIEDDSTDAEVHSQTIEELKPLHRALARITHPDISGNDDNFKMIQAAYESGDVLKMFACALDHNVSVDMSFKDLEFLEKKIEIQKKKIDKISSTARWFWYSSDRSFEVRKQIHKLLGINTGAFLEWKKDKELRDDSQDSN